MKRITLLFVAALGLCSGLPLVARSLPPAPPASPNEAVQLRLELDRPVLAADSREKVVLKIALDGRRPALGRERAPVNLALVIDKSGSMGGEEKIARAREAALEAVSRLSAEDLVSLVVYDDEVRTLVPARRVGDGEALRRAIRGIAPGGSTALHGGVETGAEELRKHIEGAYTHRVLLLSDGQANVGPRTPEALGSLGARLLREGISVTTIGLGLDFNEDLMTRLARRSDGNTYFVAESRDLPRIFAEELGDVLSIVARRVVIELEFPEGVRPLRIVGRDGRIEDGRALVELNQLYGGQEKFALVEVELEPEGDGRERLVATARVSYEDAATARRASREASVGVSFTTDPDEVVAAANHRVQADYADNRLAETREEVVALVDAGRRTEAAGRMREVGSELAVMGGTFRNSLVLDLAAPAAPAAEKVEAEGLSNEERKDYRAKAQQTFSQQRAE
jgi:Ca-activated chloride channel family protein